MKNLFVFLFLLLPFLGFSQVGFHGTFTKKTANSSFTGKESPLDGYGFGLDYTFRLAQKRIEFYPEINFSKATTSNIELDTDGRSKTLENQSFSFVFGTNFYIFDFEGDCDCPVFSKEGNFLKKGFFLQISPGVHYHNYTYTVADDFPEPSITKSDLLSYSIGGGAGIDFGISEFINITPYFRARYYFPEIIDAYQPDVNLPENTAEVSFWQISPGIRLGIQLTDEFTRNKKMRARREAKRTKKRGK